MRIYEFPVESVFLYQGNSLQALDQGKCFSQNNLKNEREILFQEEALVQFAIE